MRSLYPWPLFSSDVDSRATRSLSLQLVMQEWIATWDGLKKFSNQIKEPHALADGLQTLLLFSIESPFSVKPGTLDKLCFHWHKLLANSTITSKSPKAGNHDAILDQMQDAILDFRAQINVWKRAPSSPELIADTLHHFCTQLSRTLIHFFDALLPFFEEARSDENVMFYLIERKSRINQILEEAGLPSHLRTLEQLFSHLYPTGPAHLRSILQEGYTRRGFTDFYAQHKTVIESIAWLTDQCSTPMSTSS